MSRRPPVHIEIARAQLFDVDANRKRRIDGVIDYFGTPQRGRNPSASRKETRSISRQCLYVRGTERRASRDPK